MKKKVNQILIVVVVGLWSVIIYRLISNLLIDKNSIKNKSFSSQYSTAKITDKDTFTLPANLSDPFLGNRKFTGTSTRKKKSYPKTKVSTKSKGNSRTSKITLNKQISFHGYFYNSANKTESMVVKVDSKLFTVKIKDIISGVQFLDRKGDSVKVRLDNKEIRWIKKLNTR